MMAQVSPRPSHLVPIDTVATMLAGRILALVAELLPHGKRVGHEWRCGSGGAAPGDSFGVHLVGGKAGVWCDFKSGEAGDALDLVAHVRFRGDKSAALRWARAWLGLDGADPAALTEARQEARRAADHRDAQAAETAEDTRRAAQALWLHAVPEILGTPVDLYLRGRGIAIAELPRLPRALRFHPALWHQPSGRKWPAMVAAISSLEGQHVATHRTWLEVQADGAVRKAPVDPAKMVLGAYRGAAIRLWRGASGRPLADAPEGETVDISEGIEDGLTIATCVPQCRVLAAVSLSNMGTISLTKNVKRVRLWLQNDRNNAALLAGDRAVQAHLAAHRSVLIPEIPRQFKDVNDYLTGSEE